MRICRTCPADISLRGNAAVYCAPCRVAVYAAPTERPCKNQNCTVMVQRNGKVYPDYCSSECKPRCAFEGCGRPRRKGGLCVGHYRMHRKAGTLRPLKYSWLKLENCKVCGSKLPKEWKSGQFCRSACWAHWHAHAGNPPVSARCSQCGSEIPLVAQGGRRRRCDILTCEDCQWRYDHRKVMSKAELAARDGTTCPDCQQEVDLAISWPDPMCGSVDHILPRSRGGGNEPENLRLVHLICNLRKGAKIIN